MDDNLRRQVEKIIGYEFSNSELLSKALTHSSSVDSRLMSNERLEFFGDAVLATVICQRLFEQFPNYLEGELTKMKSMLVSRETCARITKKMGLHKTLKIGKSMASSRALSGSLAAGLLEAVIAAVYIDGGYNAAQDFILKAFASSIDHATQTRARGNYKSLLQQHAQEQFNSMPVYVLLDEKGPDHDKCFESEVVIGQQHFSSAWGTNKKEAEQKAARNALIELGVLQGVPFEKDKE